jgi:hypothetical protein
MVDRHLEWSWPLVQWNQSPIDHNRSSNYQIIKLSDYQTIKIRLLNVVAIVIGFNVSLALFCLGLVWQLHQFKQKLRRASSALAIAEQKTHQTLDRAPYYILMGQGGTQQLRQSIADLDVLQRGLGNLSTLLGLLYWIHNNRRQPRKGLKMSLNLARQGLRKG